MPFDDVIGDFKLFYNHLKEVGSHAPNHTQVHDDELIEAYKPVLISLFIAFLLAVLILAGVVILIIRSIIMWSLKKNARLKLHRYTVRQYGYKKENHNEKPSDNLSTHQSVNIRNEKKKAKAANKKSQSRLKTVFTSISSAFKFKKNKNKTALKTCESFTQCDVSSKFFNQTDSANELDAQSNSSLKRYNSVDNHLDTIQIYRIRKSKNKPLKNSSMIELSELSKSYSKNEKTLQIVDQ